MKRRIVSLACLVVLLILSVPATAFAQAAAPATRHLSRFDVASPPGEFDQVLLIVDLPPGSATTTHTHGGRVHVTVLEGEAAFQVRGGPVRTFKTGETWIEIPGEYGVASNPGTAKARLGATVILPKGAAVTTNDAGQTSPNAPVGAITVHRVTLPITSAPTPLEIAQFVVEFPANSWTALHTHGGQGFVLVTEGEATLERAGAQQRFKVGETWVDSSDVVHRAGNTTGAPAAVFASFLLPKGATLTTAQSGQTGTAPGAAAAPGAAPARPGGPPPAVLIAQTAEFAAVRARWEGKTQADVLAAGYQMDPVCVRASDAGLPAALGSMGYHAVNPQVLGAQFAENKWDPQTPAVLLLDANKRVVGLEWEGRNTGQPPVLFGQTAALLPGHPGPPEVNVPHYMLHAYFRPNGMVLFDVFDPQLQCPAPAAAPTQLPRTGGAPLALSVLAAIGLMGVGIAARRSRGD